MEQQKTVQEVTQKPKKCAKARRIQLMAQKPRTSCQSG